MAEKADSEQLALRTAEKLLREMKPRPGSELRHTLLTNMAAVSTKNKHTVEQALASFMEICSNEVMLFRLLVIGMIIIRERGAANIIKLISCENWKARRKKSKRVLKDYIQVRILPEE